MLKFQHHESIKNVDDNYLRLLISITLRFYAIARAIHVSNSMVTVLFGINSTSNGD